MAGVLSSQVVFDAGMPLTVCHESAVEAFHCPSKCVAASPVEGTSQLAEIALTPGSTLKLLGTRGAISWTLPSVALREMMTV